MLSATLLHKVRWELLFYTTKYTYYVSLDRISKILASKRDSTSGQSCGVELNRHASVPPDHHAHASIVTCNIYLQCNIIVKFFLTVNQETCEDLHHYKVQTHLWMYVTIGRNEHKQQLENSFAMQHLWSTPKIIAYIIHFFFKNEWPLFVIFIRENYIFHPSTLGEV